MATTQQIRDGAPQEAAEATKPDHGHYWEIEKPNGPTSLGRCKICGEVREFKNSVQITSWESDGSHVNRNQSLSGS